MVKAWEDASGMSSYKWKLYIRDEEDFLQKNLKKATIYLHSSYKPDDVVQLEQYPFVISRTRWGEFPLKIELDFVGAKHPIPLYYQLRLTQGRNSTRWVLGNELKYNIKLEKLSSSNPQTSINECHLAPLVERPISDSQTGKDHFTISGVGSNASLQREKKLCFCKFCGAQHLSLRYFSTMQQNCEYRLKLEHINSYTIFNEKRALECCLNDSSASSNENTVSSRQLIPWIGQIPKLRSNFRMFEFVQLALESHSLSDVQQQQVEGDARQHIAPENSFKYIQHQRLCLWQRNRKHLLLKLRKASFENSLDAVY